MVSGGNEIGKEEGKSGFHYGAFELLVVLGVNTALSGKRRSPIEPSGLLYLHTMSAIGSMHIKTLSFCHFGFSSSPPS